MSHSVTKLLERFRTESENYTHTSMMLPYGKFYIGRESQDVFWEAYCEYIEENEDPMIGITEVTKAITPLRVDIDLKIIENEKFEFDATTRLYSNNELLHVVKIFQDILKEVIEECKDCYLYCFVLEKEPFIKKNKDKRELKNGFHLHFPYVFLAKEDISNYVFPRAKERIKKDLFVNYGISDDASSNKIMDSDAIVKNNWLLYGSKKSAEEKAYFLTKIFDKNLETIELENALSEYLLYDTDENIIDLKDKEYSYLPRVLSIVPNARRKLSIKISITSLFNIKKKEQRKIIKTFNEAVINEQLKEAKTMLPLLKDQRADNYSDWIQVLWSLYNISGGSQNGLTLFLEFSSRCRDKYDEDACIREWDRTVLQENGLGIGSLILWARSDNPQKFIEITQKRSIEHIKYTTNLMSGGHNDFAKAMKERFGNQYVCASITANIWYEFQDNKWKQIEEGHSLRMKITEYLVPLVLDEIRKLYDKNLENLANIDFSEDSKNPNEHKLKYYQKIISSLKSSPFKSNIMKEAKEVFFDPHFMKKLNKNKFLIGFKNGVYDLKLNKFREGLPDDYISMSMGVDYKDFDETSQDVQNVYDFFEKIFPDKELRNYFLSISSDIFVGGNQNKKVYFWSGEGDNGKSVTQILFEKMLGDYSKKLPTSIITGKRTQSSSATPELARIGNGVRWCVAQEPDKKDELNIGILKELSGNDTFYARGLFKEGEDIEPMFKLVVICNDPPKIPQSDKATWNRIRVFPFESTFCDADKCPSTYEEQLREYKFPKDPYFEEKIPGMLEAFAWVLLEHRKRNVVRVEPRKVWDATEMYRVKNDVYKMFINDMLVKTDDSFISIHDFYVNFKTWFKESMSHGNPPSREDVREYLSKNYSSNLLGGSRLKGFRFKTREDDYDFNE